MIIRDVFIKTMEVTMIEIIAIIIVFIFFLAGLFGTLFPGMPGPPLIWAGMLVYGFIAGFQDLGAFFLIAQAALALLVMGVDYLFSALGSKVFGGSKAALWGAALGLLIGLFFFPYGLLLGPFLGAAVAELLVRSKSDQVFRSGVGATLGFWGALPIKLALEAVMIVWFIARIF